MGCDWPHAEGLANPTDYIDDLRRADFSDDERPKVMRDNGLGLTQRAAVAVA